MPLLRGSGFQAVGTGLGTRGRQVTGSQTSQAEACSQRPTDDHKQAKGIKLLEWKELSTWRQNGSEHLRTGYREEHASLCSCLHSWLYIHNETVNIFSHIFGMILFLALPLYIFGTEIAPRYELATPADILVCSIYFLGVGICFALSALFHTVMCHSEAMYSNGVILDYQGVMLLMWGANVPLIYYSYPCDFGLQLGSWGFNTILAVLCSYATFHQSIGGPALGHIRALLFAAFGFSSVVAPAVGGVLKHGFEAHSHRVGLYWIGVTAVFNATGVVAYAAKFPERWYPRTFDIIGASHQIMHIMALSAAVAYTEAMLQAFDYHHHHRIACV
ncbi:hemolysin-III channel protein-like protein Izh2 [Whalleya microplaca]|nr:hemolysin-III channel protein-like protein Izh2 [Whalleya microplaca]